MKKKVLFLLLLIFMFSIVLTPSNTIYAAEQEVYDVVLFWGQSNMVGYAGKYNWEKEVDKRINEVGIEEFSELTGIKKEILENTVAVNHTKVEQVKGSVFEYIYSNELNADNKTRGSLKELDINTVEVGQKLVYNKDKGLLDTYSAEIHDGYYSLQMSYGTNMIPQFCQEYYRSTGRKVIVVMCANGGEEISNFLPSTDEDYGEKNKEKPQYIYEAMFKKYSEAIKYLENNGYKIGQKLYVVCQARPDIKNITNDQLQEECQKKYEEVFAKIDNYLEIDLGITKGAIVLNGSEPGANYRLVNAVKDAQINLTQRDDIILGSDFTYNNYVPEKEIYEEGTFSKFTYEDGTKMTHENAKIVSRYSLCYSEGTYENGTLHENNENHFTSAALSQIGYEVANSFSNVDKIEIVNLPSKTRYYQGETLNASGLKIKVTYGNGTTEEITEGVTCTPTTLNTAGTQEIVVTYSGKTTKFNVIVENKEETDNNTEKIKQGDKLKIKLGLSCWMYKGHVNQSINSGTKYNTIKGEETLEVIEVDNNWIKVKINKVKKLSNKIKFKPESVYYIYYNPATDEYLEIEGCKEEVENIPNDELKIVDVVIVSSPSKTNYELGETLNTNGLTLKITYNNGTTENISDGFTCTPTTLNTAGTQEIVVTYSGKTTKFNVIVENKEETDNDTEKIKQGDKLKIKSGSSCWMYKGYVNQNINSGTKYNTIKGEETLEVIGVDNNWIKVKINKVKKLSNRIKFIPGNTYYIYYNSTESKIFDIIM